MKIFRITMADANKQMQNKTVSVPAGKGFADAVAATHHALGVTNDIENAQHICDVDIVVS